MKKHYRLIVVLVVLSLVGGGFLHTTNSSASLTANSQNDQIDIKQTNHDQYKGHQQKYTKKHPLKRYKRWHQTYFFNNWKHQGNNKEQNKPNKDEQANENVNQPNEIEQNDQTNANQPNNSQQNEQNQNRPAENQQQTGEQGADLGNVSEFEKRVIELTNKERAAYGLSPLRADYELGRVAKEKSRDMLNYQYFDHNSPVYGSPFDMMDAYQVSYRTAGENIAKGQRSPEEVVNAWMNSEGHRANILNGGFTHIGVGFIENGNIWTQQFIGK